MSEWTRLADTPQYRAALATVKATRPTCGICGHPGADTLDHIIPISQAPDLARDPGNWQPAHGVNGCPMCPPNPSSDRRRRGKPQRCNQAKGNKVGHTISPRSRHW